MRFCRIVESEKTLKIMLERPEMCAEDARGMVASFSLGKDKNTTCIQLVRVLSEEDIEKIIATRRN